MNTVCSRRGGTNFNFIIFELSPSWSEKIIARYTAFRNKINREARKSKELYFEERCNEVAIMAKESKLEWQLNSLLDNIR